MIFDCDHRRHDVRIVLFHLFDQHVKPTGDGTDIGVKHGEVSHALSLSSP
jgi:hypothetical protein